MLTAIEAMMRYIEDLEHMYDRGLDGLNFFTSGTPYFDNKEEAEEYILQLKALVIKLHKS